MVEPSKRKRTYDTATPACSPPCHYAALLPAKGELKRRSNIREPQKQMRNAAGIPKRVGDSLGKHSCEATKRDSEAGVYVRLVNWKAEHRSTAVFRRASEERRTVDSVPSVGMPIDCHPGRVGAAKPSPARPNPRTSSSPIPPCLVACWGASR